MKAYINGEEQEITHKGGYLYIERIWENADKVTLDFKIETKVVKLNNSQAIVRGPLLFARDSRFNDGDIDECATIKCNNQGVIQAKIKKKQNRNLPLDHTYSSCCIGYGFRKRRKQDSQTYQFLRLFFFWQ